MAVPTEVEIHAAVASVDDPEYPGVSIVDLGLLETLRVGDDGGVHVGLIPTFSGCPALAVIADDVRAAVDAVAGVTSCEVEWLRGMAWGPERISVDAAKTLAGEFTVAVQIGARAPRCPRCGSATAERSMFGPSRCRSIHVCTGCGETVEVMRG